jgi:hypothetical protein
VVSAASIAQPLSLDSPAVNRTPEAVFVLRSLGVGADFALCSLCGRLA